MNYSDFLKKVKHEVFSDIVFEDQLATLNYLVDEENISEFYLKYKDRKTSDMEAYIFEENKVTLVTLKDKSVQFDVHFYRNIKNVNLDYIKDGSKPTVLKIDFGYNTFIFNSSEDYFKKEKADKRIAYIYKLVS